MNDYNIDAADRAAMLKNAENSVLREMDLHPGKALKRALKEAKKPLTAVQKRVKARVEAQGFEYACVPGSDGIGCILRKGK